MIVDGRRIHDHRGADQRRLRGLRSTATSPGRCRGSPPSSAGCRRSTWSPTAAASATSKSSTRRRRGSGFAAAKRAGSKGFAPAGIGEGAAGADVSSRLPGPGQPPAGRRGRTRSGWSRWRRAGRTGSDRPQRDRDRDRRKLGRDPVPLQRFRRRVAHPDPQQLDRQRRPPTCVPKTATGRDESSSPTRTSTSSKRDAAGAISGAGNQSAPPLFLCRRRRLPRGPGLADDRRRGRLRGSARSTWPATHALLGPAPDIGAFEFVPAAARCGGAHLALRRRRRPSGREAAAVRSSAGREPAKRRRGATVRYALTAAAHGDIQPSSGRCQGRRVGGKCRKQTAANRGKKKCTRFRPLKGGFDDQGAAGENSFRFSGRIGAQGAEAGEVPAGRERGSLAAGERAFTITR